MSLPTVSDYQQAVSQLGIKDKQATKRNIKSAEKAWAKVRSIESEWDKALMALVGTDPWLKEVMS